MSIIAKQYVSGTVVIRGGQIIADVIVIGVTWKATYHAHSEKSMSSLARVLFTNGEYAFSQSYLPLTKATGTVYFMYAT